VFRFDTIPIAWYGIKDLLTNHTYRVFGKSGHSPHLKEQELLDSVLFNWLKEK
jgi:hypothetical protein